MKKEIKEELLCDIEIGELIVEIVHEYPTIKVRLITYYAKILSGEPISTEHERLAWVPRNVTMSLKWAPSEIPTLDILIGRKKGTYLHLMHLSLDRNEQI